MACRFHKQTDMSVACKIFGQGRAHVEVMKGLISENVTYCSKEKLFLERGARPEDTPGLAAKAKMDGMVAMIKDRKSDREVFEAFPAMWLRLFSSLNVIDLNITDGCL